MKVIAHRIRGFDEPDNSLAALKKATKSDIDGIELDVRVSKDEILICWHDKLHKRKRVSKMLAKHLKKNNIMTLEEAIKVFKKRKNTNQILNIDIKQRGYELEILELIHKHKIEKNVVLVSWSERILRTVHKLNNNIPLSFSFRPKFNGPLGVHQPIPIWPFLPRILSKKHADIKYVNLVPGIGWVSIYLINRLVRKEMEVVVVNEDSIRGNKRLAKNGIYATMTNYPQEIKKMFQK